MRVRAVQQYEPTALWSNSVPNTSYTERGQR